MLNKEALVDRLVDEFNAWELEVPEEDKVPLAYTLLAIILDADDYPTEGGDIGYDEDAMFSEYHWPETED